MPECFRSFSPSTTTWLGDSFEMRELISRPRLVGAVMAWLLCVHAEAKISGIVALGEQALEGFGRCPICCTCA